MMNEEDFLKEINKAYNRSPLESDFIVLRKCCRIYLKYAEKDGKPYSAPGQELTALLDELNEKYGVIND